MNSILFKTLQWSRLGATLFLQPKHPPFPQDKLELSHQEGRMTGFVDYKPSVKNIYKDI